MTDPATEQSVFENTNGAEPTQSEPATQDVQSPVFQIPDQVKALIGEGGKYSDVNKALESIPHSQAHIATLEEENARLRVEAAKAEALKEVLEQMKTSQPAKPDPVQPVDSSDVAKQAVNLINQQAIAEKRAANELAASKAMTEAYGDKAVAVLQSKAGELGMSVDALRNVAMDSPDAFLKLVIDKKQEGPITTPIQKTSNYVPSGTPTSTRKEGLLSTPSSTADFVNEWRRVKELVGPE